MPRHPAAAPRPALDARTREAIERTWREESAAVTAHVARLVRDVGLAEELAQDALLAALEHWPVDGLPDKPGAWLMTTAKHRALDRLRHQAVTEREHAALAADLAALERDRVPDISEQVDARRHDVGDELLRLIFTTCHPVLPREQRVALALKVLGGLDTPALARAFLVTEATLAQRIVRAKRTLAQAKVGFEMPGPEERGERVASVLEVIYLIFTEGHAATAGERATRTDLCAEALRLARLLARLMPQDGEVQGLLALLALQASRLAAREDAQGRPVRLDDQDRGRWDRALIDEGLRALARSGITTAAGSAGTTRPGAAAPAAPAGQEPGPYALQAALAACHARAAGPAETDWAAIVALYDRLLALQASPVVALNRAVALARVAPPQGGAARALTEVDALGTHEAMRRYPWWHAVRADLLARTGRPLDAAQAWAAAADRTDNRAEREDLQARAAACRTDALKATVSPPGPDGAPAAR
jgi:RNA polymerase sigma factor (sigma-70 family)